MRWSRVPLGWRSVHFYASSADYSDRKLLAYKNARTAGYAWTLDVLPSSHFLTRITDMRDSPLRTAHDRQRTNVRIIILRLEGTRDMFWCILVPCTMRALYTRGITSFDGPLGIDCGATMTTQRQGILKPHTILVCYAPSR